VKQENAGHKKPQVISPVFLTSPPSLAPLVSYSGPPADRQFLLVCPPEVLVNIAPFVHFVKLHLAGVPLNNIMGYLKTEEEQMSGYGQLIK